MEYDGITLTCRGPPGGSSGPVCNNLPVGIAIKTVVISVDLNPRAGGFDYPKNEGEWQRNKYDFSGSYYNTTCMDPSKVNSK